MKKNILLLSIILTSLVLSSAIGMQTGSSAEDGTPKNSFTTEDSVYLTHLEPVFCNGVLESSMVVVYILEAREWEAGDSLSDFAARALVSTDENGKIPTVSIWNALKPGEYDIIVDVNKNQEYDAETNCSDLIDSIDETGFVVIQASTSDPEVVAEEEQMSEDETEEIETNETAVPEEVEDAEEEQEVVAVESAEEETTVLESAEEPSGKKMDYMPFVIIGAAVLIAVLIVAVTFIKMR